MKLSEIKKSLDKYLKVFLRKSARSARGFFISKISEYRILFGMLKLNAEGLKNNVKKRIIFSILHKDAYFLTAIPAGYAILQLLENENCSPGFFFQSEFVETEKFFEGLKRSGIQIEILENNFL